MGKEKEKKKKLSKKERKRREERFEAEQHTTDIYKEIIIERPDFDEMYPPSEDQVPTMSTEDADEDEELGNQGTQKVTKFDALLASRPDTIVYPLVSNGNHSITVFDITEELHVPLTQEESTYLSHANGSLFFSGNRTNGIGELEVHSEA